MPRMPPQHPDQADVDPRLKDRRQQRQQFEQAPARLLWWQKIAETLLRTVARASDWLRKTTVDTLARARCLLLQQKLNSSQHLDTPEAAHKHEEDAQDEQIDVLLQQDWMILVHHFVQRLVVKVEMLRRRAHDENNLFEQLNNG